MSLLMNKAAGFTLIEVLVSVLVLAAGLLGLAALQANGVKNNQLAYNRSQAVHLAQDIADRIRANPGALITYADVNANGTQDYSESPPMPSAAIVAACSTAAGCTPAELAKTDINQWQAALAAVLPSGCGSILRGTDTTVAADVDNGCGGKVPKEVASTKQITISINWDEDNDGNRDAHDPNFMMSFQLGGK